MADKNLDGNGLNEVWTRAAQLVKKYTGAVDLTKGNLQTQVDTKITGTDDTKDNVVTFTSNDVADPTVWQEVSVMSSNEKHSSLFNKISTMFSNMRYLYKILGSTDISALGSVTQAIATLNGNVGNMKGISSSSAITVQGQYALDAREKNASVEGTLANELSKVNSSLNDTNNRINWNYLDAIVGNNLVTLPSNWIELHLLVKISNNYLFLTFNILKYDIVESLMVFRQGYYSASDNHCLCSLKIENNVLSIHNAFQDGVDRIGNTTAWIFYR